MSTHKTRKSAKNVIFFDKKDPSDERPVLGGT